MIECALKMCGLVLPSYLSVGHSSEKQVEFLIEFAFSLGTVVEGLLPLKLQHSCRDWRLPSGRNHLISYKMLVFTLTMLYQSCSMT